MAKVIIVGGGLAGLTCAKELTAKGSDVQLFEASDGLGGRVRTDEVDGFLLDRGFQVLLTAYPAAQEILDYDSLDLQRFQAGALIRHRGKLHRFADPWRQPEHLLATAFSSVATVSDKLLVNRLRSAVSVKTLEEIYQAPDSSSLEFLQKFGFSERIIQTFFRPFFGGVFLESELATTSRKLQFVFKMFGEGYAAVPAKGMQQLPLQLAESLPADAVHLNRAVESVSAQEVRLADGSVHAADAVVIATESTSAARLLGEAATEDAWNRVRCAYFAAEKSPWPQPVLILNGEGAGPINNLCTMTEASSQYSPDNRQLVSVSVVDSSLPDETLAGAILDQAVEWFGEPARHWQHLKTYDVRRALPRQTAGFAEQPLEHPSGVVRCGDYFGLASIQSAMESGKKAAELVSAKLPVNA